MLRAIFGRGRRQTGTAPSGSVAGVTVSESKLPLIKRPEGCRYRTILSVDGGGVRGIIPTMVLLRLEDEIKNYIFEHRDTLVPEPTRSSINSVHDFDIDLTDYFDFCAGASVGSWIAGYIASRGKGSQALVDKVKKDNPDERVRVGSINAVRLVFQRYAKKVFPPLSECMSCYHFIRGLFQPLYSDRGLKELVEDVFGDLTLNDLETGLFVDAYEMDSNSPCGFLHSGSPGSPSYYVRIATRYAPRTSPEDSAATETKDGVVGNDDWKADLEIMDGKQILVRDITRASSSCPPLLPPAVVRCPDTDTELTLVDGGLIANNPAMLAVSFDPLLARAETAIENTAVFSLGCGVAYPNQKPSKNPGLWWWLGNSYMVNITIRGAGEYLQEVMDFAAYRGFKWQPGQYSRFQIKTLPEDDDNKYIISTANANYVDELELMGERLANENGEAIRAFVENFIFKTYEK